MDEKFTKRFENFKSMQDRLEKLTKEEATEVVLGCCTSWFNLTFELAWKTAKDVLIQRYGITNFAKGSPKEVLSISYEQGLIDDMRAWLEMLELRNQFSHDYDGTVVEESFERIGLLYCRSFSDLARKIESVTADEHAKKLSEFENEMRKNSANNLDKPHICQ